MDKIKNFAMKNKIQLGVYAMAFTVLLVTYSIFFRDYYTADHVYSYVFGYLTAKPAGLWYYFLGGRPMNFFFAWINYGFAQLGMNYLFNSWIFTLIHLLILSAAVTVVYGIFADKSKSINPIVFMLTMMPFISPMYTDNIVFHGYELACAVLLSALAARFFVNAKYIRAFIFLVLSVCIYQMYFELFLIWVTAFLLIHHKNRCEKSYLLKFAGMTGMAIGSLAFNIISQKLVIFVKNKMIYKEAMTEALEAGQTIDPNTVYQVTEQKPYSAILDNRIFAILKPALCAIKAVFKDVSYPSCFFEVLTAVICVMLLIKLIRSRSVSNRTKVAELLVTAASLFALSFYYIVIYLSGITDYAGRIIWPYYACVAAVIMVALHSFDVSSGDVKSIRIRQLAICALFLLLFGFNRLYSTDFFINQSLDRQVIGAIDKEIESYEAETGIKVTTIATRESDETEYVSSHLLAKYNFYGYSYNGKTYTTSWADVELLNFLTGKNYQEVELTDDEYIKIFGNKKWDEFNPREQLVFDKDTVYWSKF